jgi:creatinine amidohydrolase
METRWMYLTSEELGALREKVNNVCVISWGAVEKHGLHLPLGTDTLTAEALSEMVAAKVNAVIAPTIDIGESSGLMSFPGTLTVSLDNYEHYMENVIQVLIDRGFKNILFRHLLSPCLDQYV